MVRWFARVSSVQSVACCLCMVHVKSESLETISIKVEVHGNPCYELVNQEGYVCFHNETIQEYLY